VWLRASAAALLQHVRHAEVRAACDLLAALDAADGPLATIGALLAVRARCR
jgi:hypothetical protein